MKIRTFLILLLNLAATAAAALLVIRNKEVLSAPFEITDTSWVPLYGVLGAAFLMGALTILTGFVFRDSKDFLARLQGLRGKKETRQLEKLFQLGMESFLEGQEEKALVHFQAVLSANPNHFDTLLQAGRVQRALRNYPDAADYHRRAHRLRKNDLEPLYELDKDYHAQSEFEKSKVVLNKLIKMRPRKALTAYRKLRKYAMLEGDWERAWQIQALIEGQTEKTPFKLEVESRFSVGIRYQLSQEKAKEGKDKEAANSLRKLVRSDPNFIPGHIRLGEALIRLGQGTAGVEAWARGFEATGSPVFLTFLEEHFLEISEPEMAIEALRTAVTRSADDFMPRLFLARLYLRLEMIAEAAREFAPLKDRADDSPTVRALLGSIHERRGEYEQAVTEYRTALEALDLVRFYYRCDVCDTRYTNWLERCGSCMEWNQISIDLSEDPALDEMGAVSGPIYSSVS